MSRKKIPSIINHSKKAHEKGGNMQIGLALVNKQKFESMKQDQLKQKGYIPRFTRAIHIHISLNYIHHVQIHKKDKENHFILKISSVAKTSETKKPILFQTIPSRILFILKFSYNLFNILLV